jgi:hypothetical protein
MINTGLKLANAKTMEQAGKSMTQVTNFVITEKLKEESPNIIQNVGFELDIKMSEVKLTKALRMLILNN